MRLSLRGCMGAFPILVLLTAGTAAAEMPDILGVQLGMQGVTPMPNCRRNSPRIKFKWTPLTCRLSKNPSLEGFGLRRRTPLRWEWKPTRSGSM